MAGFSHDRPQEGLQLQQPVREQSGAAAAERGREPIGWPKEPWRETPDRFAGTQPDGRLRIRPWVSSAWLAIGGGSRLGILLFEGSAIWRFGRHYAFRDARRQAGKGVFRSSDAHYVFCSMASMGVSGTVI